MEKLERVQCECGAWEGQYHTEGCEMEKCPFCGKQLWVHCECDSKPGAGQRAPFIEYHIWCVKCGVRWTEITEDELKDIIQKSDSWIEFEKHVLEAVKKASWMVSDREWRAYVEPNQRRNILCHSCYDQIKEWIDREGTQMNPDIRSHRDPKPSPLIAVERR